RPGAAGGATPADGGTRRATGRARARWTWAGPGRPGREARSPSSLEHLPQQAPGPEELSLRGPGRDPAQSRDVLVRVSLDVVQHEHLPGSIGQSGDGALEIHSAGSRLPTPDSR